MVRRPHHNGAHRHQKIGGDRSLTDKKAPRCGCGDVGSSPTDHTTKTKGGKSEKREKIGGGQTPAAAPKRRPALHQKRETRL